jgi:hypothetical protein
MALLPDETRNFINALSSFWTTYFKDADEQRAYFEGVQINVAQLYLEMLQLILGTSLQDMPLFSRWYFKHMELRQDRLFFREGASPTDDRYVFAPDEGIVAGVETINNRVLAPTAVMVPGRDFDVQGGLLRFTRNLFDIDGNQTFEPYFAVRQQPVVEAATFDDLLGLDWKAAGARPGDSLRIRQLGGGTPRYSRIVAIEGSKLHLETALPEYRQGLATRNVQYDVVRIPYDQDRIGVPLSAYTTLAEDLGSATLTDATTTINITAQAYYRGAWAAATSYGAGDCVMQGGTLYRARVEHVSGGVFVTANWDTFQDNYVHIYDDQVPGNNGLYRVTGFPGAGQITVSRPGTFQTTTGTIELSLVVYGGSVSFTSTFTSPGVTLPQTFLLEGSVTIVAQRAHARYVGGVVYPAGEEVAENIDYVVDADAGLITFLSGWRAGLTARANYQWLRQIVGFTRTNGGDWTVSTPVAVGTVVTHQGSYWLCRVADPGSLAFDLAYYVSYRDFSFDTQVTVPTLSLWGSNVLLDEDALYSNFGYLLDFQKPSSEQYRTFLRGVAQLFIMGPALERFESAMNAMAGFPVVRDDGEILLGFDDGITASGSDGQLIDGQEGMDGVLDAATSRFTSATAMFFPSDVGGTVRVRNGAAVDIYLITSFISPQTVQLSTVPPDATNLAWTSQHVALTTRFRAASFHFTQQDVNAWIYVTGSNYARNNGWFRIIAIDNNSTVVLETPYGFTDDDGLSWKLSRTYRQVVRTNRTSYAFPIQVAVRADAQDPSNFTTLTFRAFEALTTAFQVIDYLRDPTWWHHVTIPSELLTQEADGGMRRVVTPALVEHVYNAVDSPVYGDFGLGYGVDDEGEPGIERSGDAIWFGGTSIELSFAVGTVGARPQDVGQHVRILTPGFKGFFKVAAISEDLQTLTLERFPPPEATGLVPPITISVRLPRITYRHTVAFVMMDRFLKYHAVQIRIDKNTPLPPDFIIDVTRLVAEAKPSHTFIYLESLTDFVDTLHLEESPVTVGLGLDISDPVYVLDSQLRYGIGFTRYADAFRYDSLSASISGAGPHVLPVTLPAGDSEASIIKLRFDPAVVVGSRRVAEGVDYTVNYQTCTVTLLGSFPVGAATVYYDVCIRRIREIGDPLDAGENRLIYGGADPTLYRAPTQAADQMGIIDRAVSITLGP